MPEGPAAHYDALARRGAAPLLRRLRQAFIEAGCDPHRLTLDQIAAIDQLHLGGRAASRRLAALGTWSPGRRVLDLGCGTGGASRLLADERAARVLGLDITAAFVAVADWLSHATGLGDHTRFLCADAAGLPLAAESVETVWCQHALLNMPDPERVLVECRRVLAPQGELLLHEVVRGDNAAPLRLPVPWARRGADSHLRSREALEALLADAGFAARRIEDVSDDALAWRRGVEQRRGQGKRLPGPALIFGDDFAAMGANLAANLADRRVRVLAGVWVVQG